LEGVVRPLLTAATVPVLTGRVFLFIEAFVEAENGLAERSCFLRLWTCISCHFE
jgi:hypothetical protein